MDSISVLDREFIGRRQELELLQRALLSSEELVLCFHGLAGIGKTWLVRKAVSHFGDEGVACALCNLTTRSTLDYLDLLSMIRTQLDGNHFTPYDNVVTELQERLTELYVSSLLGASKVSVEIRDTIFQGNVGDIVGVKYENLAISIPKSELERLQQDMQDKIANAFITCLQSLSARRPVLVLLDGYERIEDWASGVQTPLAGWIENTLLPKLHHNASQILFVITRREPLIWDHSDREWRACLRKHELDYFSYDEIKAYLLKRELDPPARALRRIWFFTQGHPQCLALVTDLLVELREQKAERDLFSLLDSFKQEFDEKIVSEFLVESILDLLPISLSNAVTQLAIPNWFTADVIQELTGLQPGESLAYLERILRYSFVRFRQGPRYSYHDIVRDYLRIRLRHRSQSEYIRVHRIMFDYYSSATVVSASAEISRQLREEAIYHLFPVDESAALSRFSDLFERYEQLHQRDAAEQLLNLVAKHHFRDRSTRLWMEYYKAHITGRKHQWTEVRDTCKVIIDDSESDLPLRARTFSRLGRAHWLLDEPEESIVAFQNSAEGYKELGDLDEYGWNLRNIAKVHLKHGRLDEALDNCQQCFEIFEESGDRYKIGWILKTLGVVHKQRAEYGVATAVLEKSLRIWDDLGFEYGTVDTLGALADVQRFGGSLVEAKETYARSLSLYRKHSDNYGIGWSIHGLGEVLRMQGCLGISAGYTEDSLQKFLAMNYTFGVAWNERSKGELARMAPISTNLRSQMAL